MRFNRKNKLRRAMSLVEMTISAATISIIGITVAYLMLTSAKVSKEGYNFLRSEASVRNGLDLVRRHALVGKVSTISLEDNGRTIRFKDPWAKTDPYFAFEQGALNYYPDENAAALYTISGLSDVVFSLEDGRKTLRFTVTAEAQDGNNVVRTLTLEDSIILRNPLTPSDII